MASRRGPSGRVLPDTEEEAGQALTDRVERAVLDRGRRGQGGRERALDGRLEDLLLGAEVVVHEGGVDPGGLGDAAHRRLLVAALGEFLAGRVQDAVAGGGGRLRLRTGRPSPATGGGGVRHRRGTFTAEARCRRVKASASARCQPRARRWTWHGGC